MASRGIALFLLIFTPIAPGGKSLVIHTSWKMITPTNIKPEDELTYTTMNQQESSNFLWIGSEVRTFTTRTITLDNSVLNERFTSTPAYKYPTELLQNTGSQSVYPYLMTDTESPTLSTVSTVLLTPFPSSFKTEDHLERWIDPSSSKSFTIVTNTSLHTLSTIRSSSKYSTVVSIAETDPNITLSNKTETNINQAVILPNDGSVPYFIFGCFGGYIFILFIVRRKDERDTRRVAGIVLPPYQHIEERDADWYEMQFTTSEERCAGTTANVFAKIICSGGVSQIFRLCDPSSPDRRVFKTGSVTTFLLPLPHHIGDPEGILLWHDNKGTDPCWFLRSVAVRDISSDWSKLFVFNNWLSLLQPGCRTLVFLSNEVIDGIKLTQSHTWVILRHCVMNYHLWLSILFGSPLSRLRKTQRLCCLSLLVTVLIFSLALTYKDSSKIDNRAGSLFCLDEVCLMWSDITAILRSAFAGWCFSIFLALTFQCTEQEDTFLFQTIRNFIDRNKQNCYQESQVLQDPQRANRERAESFDSGCIMSPDFPRRHRNLENNDLEMIQFDTPVTSEGKLSNGLTVGKPGLQHLKCKSPSASTENIYNDLSTTILVDQLSGRVRRNSISPSLFSINDRQQNDFIGKQLLEHGSRRSSAAGSTTIHSFLQVQETPDLKRFASVNRSMQPRKSIFFDHPINFEKDTFSKGLSVPRKLMKECESKYLIPAPLIYVIWLAIFTTCIVIMYVSYQIAGSWSNKTTKLWYISVGFGLLFDVLVLEFCLPIIELAKVAIHGTADSCNAIALSSTRNIWSNIRRQWSNTFKEETMTKFYKDYEGFAPKIPKDIVKTREKTRSKREVTLLLYSFPYYLILIAVLLAVCYGNRDPSAFNIRNHVEDIFIISAPFNGIKLKQVNNIPLLWKWWKSTLLPGIFQKSKYALRLPPENHLTLSLSDRESMLIGVPRIRQLRVQRDSCQMAPDFKTVIHECNDFYDWQNEETRKFSVGWGKWSNETILVPGFQYSPWEYWNGNQVNNSISVWGEMAVYKGGGYLAQLGRNLSRALELTKHLEENEWLDQYSRAVITELTVYCPQVNLIAYLIVTIDVLPTGLTLNRYDMGIFRLYRYLYPYQWAFLICELLLLAFIFHSSYEELGKIWLLKFKYFKSIWTFNKIVFVASGLAMLVFYVLRERFLHDGLKQFNIDHHLYISFYQIAVFDELIVYMLAVMELSAVLQFIHFLSFQKGVTIILKTLGSAAYELGGFYYYIGVWIMAFSSYAYLKFVSEVEDFSKMTSTMRSLLSLLLGGLRYDSYKNNSPYMLALMFLFIVVMYLVVANVFISIIQRSHSRVSEHYKGVKERYNMKDVGLVFLGRMFGSRFSDFWKKRSKAKKRRLQEQGLKVHFAETIVRKKSSRKHSGLQKRILQELNQAKAAKETKARKATVKRKRKYTPIDDMPSTDHSLKLLSMVQTPRLNTAVNALYSDFFAEDFVFIENMVRLITNKSTDVNVQAVKKEFVLRRAVRKNIKERTTGAINLFRSVSKSIIVIQHTYRRVRKSRDNLPGLHAILEQSKEEVYEVEESERPEGVETVYNKTNDKRFLQATDGFLEHRPSRMMQGSGCLPDPLIERRMYLDPVVLDLD